MNAAAVKKASLPNPALKTVMLYDDPACAARATALLERAAVRAGEGTQWDLKSWQLDVLKQPSLAAVTLTVAADVDLLLLALGEGHSPPRELRDWLERWAATRRCADAAMMLFGPEGTAGQRLRSQLRRFARQRGLAFLDERGAEDGEGSAFVIHLRPHRKAPAAPAFPPFVEPLPAPSHWGIND